MTTVSENTIKWIMIDANKFIAKVDKYELVVTPFMMGYPHWSILKDGVIIDEAQYHNPVTTDFNKELACKAAAEKRLNEIIKTNP